MKETYSAFYKGRVWDSFCVCLVFLNDLSIFIQLLHLRNKGKERLAHDYFYFVSIFIKTMLCFSLMSLSYFVSETRVYFPWGA